MTINYSLSDHHGTSTNVATLVADVSGRYVILKEVTMKGKIVTIDHVPYLAVDIGIDRCKNVGGAGEY